MDIDETNVRASVSLGWVTIEGVVDTYWKKREIENDVASVPGVVGVKNKLSVVRTQTRQDEIIAKDIMDAIDRNEYANVTDIDVKVRDGEVTLTGTVPSPGVRNAVYNAAQFTMGVTNVIDKLKVSYL